MGERVRGQRLEPSGKAALEFKLESMVVRGRFICCECNLDGVGCNQQFLPQKPTTNRADVGSRQRLITSQGVLHSDIPLICAWQFQVSVCIDNPVAGLRNKGKGWRRRLSGGYWEWNTE